MKKAIFALFFTLISLHTWGQESQTVYNFLRLPVSAHAAALGGDNISIIEDDASLMFHNPALIVNSSTNTVNLNFMTYMEGSVVASAAYARQQGDKATWGVQAQMLNYGSIKQTTADGQQIGNFTPSDVAVAGTLGYLLSERFSGGVTLRFIESSIAGYNSFGVGADVGLNYYDAAHDLSVSACVKNLGGQISSYNEDFEGIPVDLQVGATKKFENMPFRVSLTAVDLNHWQYSFLRHLRVGVDMDLGENFYVAAGFNPRRDHEMGITTNEVGFNGEDNKSSHGAAWSFGAGLHVNQFKLNVAYTKLHLTTWSLLASASLTL